MSDFPEGN